MTSLPAARLFLLTWCSTSPEEAQHKLAELIDTFTLEGYRCGLAHAKNIYQTLHSGGCKMLSQGDDCTCFLCQVDKERQSVIEEAK